MGYRRIAERLARAGPVLLDGGIGSELQELGYPPLERRGSAHLWGTLALYEAPDLVKAVHRRYVAAGAEVLFTDTWLIHQCPEEETAGLVSAPPGSWREKAGLAVRLAREAIAEAGRAAECAVAFTMRTIDVPPADGPGRSTPIALARVREIAAAIRREPPDLILVETMRDIAEDLSFPDYEVLLETGIPVWVAYRRTVGSQCDVDGTPFGADGDRFGRAATRFEAMGIEAVLVNCLPPDRVRGVAPWLRGYTRLPLGAYPNIGQWRHRQWWWDGAPDPARYTEAVSGGSAKGCRSSAAAAGSAPPTSPR